MFTFAIGIWNPIELLAGIWSPELYSSITSKRKEEKKKMKKNVS